MPPATTTAARAFNASRSCFSTTPVPYKQLRQGPTPEFNYRKPSFVGGVPVVEYTKDANEADEMLETLRATRLALHYDNLSQEKNAARLGRKGGYEDVEIAVLAIADIEGVIVMHLSHMKQLPRRLKAILEDPSICKQTFGAKEAIRDFDRWQDKHGDVRLANVFDLPTALGSFSAKVAEAHAGRESLAGVRSIACREFLRVDHGTLGNSQQYHVTRLAGPLLDYTVNSTWLTLQLGAKLDELLEKQMAEATAAGMLERYLTKQNQDGLVLESTWTTDEWRGMGARLAAGRQ